jgi:signal transduction histidine kinase
MPGRSLIKGYGKKRLKRLLAFFFLALAIPTAVLIWQAYSQLKWEAFHQYRGMAEELTRRIDADLAAGVNAAEARTFADYTFLVVSGDPSANFVQRSPLSELPVTQDLPGVIGYFQVGTEGEFSTPLLPPGDSDPASFGIGAVEYDQRLRLSRQIQSILSDNRLVQDSAAGSKEGFSDVPAAPPAEYEAAEDEDVYEESRRRQVTGESPEPELLEAQAAEQDEVYSQAVFDRLGAVKKSKDSMTSADKVADLRLDGALQQKSEVAEKLGQEGKRDNLPADAPGRSKRREQIALPESGSAATMPVAQEPAANLAEAAGIRISTFESEIDPLEFSLLDSGHFVLFRKVWRDGQRFIQGLLIDREIFIRGAFDDQFADTGLAAMSKLIVAYQDDVLHTLSGENYSEYTSRSQPFDGALLYRNRLAEPLNRFELIYSINGLPSGPGATVLGWVTFVLAIVFLGGFYTVYRLGLSQIKLARQQQDFVSAVSHELKTPLTSIRMYGEMLREGWADPEKQQQYYAYIHDESERLTRLISNVLQLAKITRNEPQFDLKPVPVGDLMNRIESKITGQVQSAGFALEFITDPRAGKASIEIDEDCFSQIVINLVDNAIKFSSNAEEKRIEISGRLNKASEVVIAVRDFGPGVPKDQLKKIFQLFYRSESELTRETVGTGIGLAIVHQLSQAMGGKVDVMNREPGVEFRVSFPSV